MLSLILLLIIIFIAAGIVGFVVKGLFWLFIVAIILFAITIIASLFGTGQRRGRRSNPIAPPSDSDKEE